MLCVMDNERFKRRVLRRYKALLEEDKRTGASKTLVKAVRFMRKHIKDFPF